MDENSVNMEQWPSADTIETRYALLCSILTGVVEDEDGLDQDWEFYVVRGRGQGHLQ